MVFVLKFRFVRSVFLRGDEGGMPVLLFDGAEPLSDA